MKTVKIVVSCVLLGSTLSASASNTSKFLLEQRANAKQILINKVTKVSNNSKGDIQFIKGDFNLALPKERTKNREDAFVKDLKVILGFSGREAFELNSDRASKAGARFVRYKQIISGIEVVGGDVIIDVDDRTNKVTALTNYATSDLNLPTHPVIKASSLNVSSGKPELIYFNDKEGTKLAWRYNTLGSSVVDYCEIPFVTITDAMNGEKIVSYPIQIPAMNRIVSTYFIPVNEDPCDPFIPPVIELVANEAMGAPSDVNQLNIWTNLKKSYDYFSGVHNRDSWDGNGGDMVAYARTGAAYNNAYWLAGKMHLGNGDGVAYGNFSASLDIIAHELGHGVVEDVAGLIYYGESGAINESIADIFGAGTEFREGYNNSNVWKIGEATITPNVPGDAIRYMNSPTSDGSSVDHFSDYIVTAEDSGGVHSNSGISNYAFYLLSKGGTHAKSSISVNGIGQRNAEEIFYQALEHLSANATFEQLQLTSVEAAIDLFGLNTTQHLSTCDAWHAVGVINPNANCSAPVLPAEPPASPTNVSSISLQCFGQNNLTWNSVADATSYEIYKSNYANFSGGILHSTTSNTNRMVSISRYTNYVYFKVKACNEGGCSDLSSSYARATYTSSCR